MIHYQLRCEAGHEFDGWFAGSAAFDRQAERGLLECPSCGTHAVTRALMAPSIPRRDRAAAPAASADQEGRDQGAGHGAQPAAEGGTAQALAGRLPPALRAQLARLRQEIEARCDYVGNEFAAEARRIHDGVSPERGIYGEASSEDVEALAEDGIEVARVPWVPRADS